jgi:hypothetical protein
MAKLAHWSIMEKSPLVSDTSQHEHLDGTTAARDM